jgi:DNA polymerase III subunit delta'
MDVKNPLQDTEQAIELPWLEAFADAWRGRERQERLPHAVMLAGTPGVGKRAAACWIARRRLAVGEAGPLPVFPAALPEHADLHRVCKPEDRLSIGIGQIRELIADLSLTSYEGGAKVAVIEPANLMTVEAANSLLKTLEEPPGDALLVLIADSAGRLPATILSRCQRLNFAVPAADVSLAWLNRRKPAANWAAALTAAGNAPLAAIDALEALGETTAMGRDFAAVAERRASPVEVAARWARLEPQFVLGWLGRQVQQCIYRLSDRTRGTSGSPVPDSVLGRMDSPDLFCYLDTINRLRAQPAGSFNPQLTLESLLIDWALGLANYRDAFSPGGLLPVPGTR